MHACLQVPEIISLIFDNFIERRIDSPSIRRPWPFEGSSTLLNLAVSCKAFTEPALDCLWFFALQFDDLVKCLPDDACSIGDGDIQEVKLLRDLKPEDFTKFNYYAKKIRVFGEFYEIQNLQETGVLQIYVARMHPMVLPIVLSRNPSKRLFPNLRLFNIQVLPYDVLGWEIRAPVSDSLDSINIRVRSSRGENVDLRAVNNTTTALEKVACTLRNFSIFSKEGPSLRGQIPHSEEVRALVPHFKRIESLRMLNVPITSVDLCHLMELPTLRCLQVTLPSSTVKAFLKVRPTIACGLEDIALRVESLADTTDLLAYIGRATLKSLQLVRRTRSNEMWNLDDFFSAAKSQNIMAGLSCLQIQAPLSIRACHPERLATDVTVEVVEKLLSFRHIQVLRLSLNSRVLIDPDTLQGIATAWPQLEVLDLHERTTGAAPQITLCDAARFIARCPKLTELHLRVDASNEHIGLADIQDITPSRQLQTLDLCTSPAPRRSLADAIPGFLAFTFPGLRNLSFGWDYSKGRSSFPSTHSAAEKSHYEKWKDVYDGLNELLKFDESTLD